MVEFYTPAFGWQTHMPGGYMGNQVTATINPMLTQKEGPKGGIIYGGFYTKDDKIPANHLYLINLHPFEN